MIFFNEMTSKYGFSDGEAMPLGVEKYREAYIRAINKIASTLGSGVRACAYNRSGFHNWCLLLFVNAVETAVFTEFDLATGGAAGVELPRFSEVPMDALMEEAVAIALDADIDFSVDVVVSVNEAELAMTLQYCHETAVARRDELQNKEVNGVENAES